MIQLFRLILLLVTFAYSIPLKPINSKNIEIVKISDENKTRTYYHLDKKSYLKYPNLNEVFSKQKDYTVKIITRTKISKNSNSSKSFGYILNIIEGKDTTTKELKFKKKVSPSKVPNKRGFSYTNAGFWLEEMEGSSKARLLIKPLKGSPEVDVRIVYNEIIEEKFDSYIDPVNIVKSNTVYFLRDSSLVKSKNWYQVNKNSEFQFKAVGPAVLKIMSRSDDIYSDNNLYGFKIEENGKFMARQNHKIIKSKKDAYYFDEENNKKNLTKYNTMYFNVPDGLNYYLIDNIKSSKSNVLVKVETNSITSK